MTDRRRALVFLAVVSLVVFGAAHDPAVPDTRGMAFAYRCHGLGAALFLLMGLVYMNRRQFMPYHGVALGKPWEEMEPAAQVVFLASMRIIGAAWIALAVAMGLMLRHGYAEGLPWVVYGVPAVGLLVSAPTLAAVLRVRARTSASPPWPPLALAVMLFAAGLVISLAVHPA